MHFAEGRPDPKGLTFTARMDVGQKRCVETSDIPVAVINGKDEPFVNLEWIRQIKFRNLWRNTFFEMENCLHAPFWARRKEYGDLLSAFLNEVS